MVTQIYKKFNPKKIPHNLPSHAIYGVFTVSLLNTNWAVLLWYSPPYHPQIPDQISDTSTPFY